MYYFNPENVYVVINVYIKYYADIYYNTYGYDKKSDVMHFR